MRFSYSGVEVSLGEFDSSFSDRYFSMDSGILPIFGSLFVQSLSTMPSATELSAKQSFGDEDFFL